MEPNTLNLSDQELKILAEILRNTKLDLNSEQILMVLRGEAHSPILDLTVKIQSAWEQRTKPAPEEDELL